MKVLFKILSVFLAISIVLVAVWYFYFFKRFSTLQDVDRQTVLESFKPDSNGDGLSDDAEKLLIEDFNKIKSLNTEEFKSLKFWTVEHIKFKRILALSKSRNEYLSNSKKYYKIFRCSNLYLHKLDDNKYNFIDENGFENSNFNEIQHFLEKKNFRFLSFDEIFSIQNPDIDGEHKCESLKKEIFR